MADVALLVPADLRDWIKEGRRLGQAERTVMWDIGDWWNRGHNYGDRKGIVTAPDWDGPSYETCRKAGAVAGRFDVCRRRHTLPYLHHAEVAALAPAEAEAVLDEAEREVEKTGKPPPHRVIRATVKQRRRKQREEELAEATAVAATAIGTACYGVIYADPPWRFEPYSRATGMDRAADNHYPTMELGDIRAINVPAAKDAVLFLWATQPMLESALAVMRAWGFCYRSHFVWAKPHAGTGYWTRSQHELLLIGTRGNVPAPAPGQQCGSVVAAPLGKHSVKPAAFAEIIEATSVRFAEPGSAKTG